MLDIIKDTLIDGIKLLPFLFIAFLIIELVEHKLSNKTQKIITKSNKYGPVLGSLFGAFPQCGFSVLATNLYVTRIISLGTLIAIYLSTSDEMLPILITNKVSFKLILIILLIKIIIGIIFGYIIDFFWKKKETKDFSICDDDHCHCEKGIFKSSLIHTLKISSYILITTFLLNTLIYYLG
ncbi:MAG: arsenic efflux protein, partial [Tenericutes bacterium]|nr:arsenic efflux protein [Mycoplasmatota bacterium]